MPLATLPSTVHRRILSHLPWQSHLPASKALSLWNKILDEDEFKDKRYSQLRSSAVRMHRLLIDPIGFKVTFFNCGKRKAVVRLSFYTTEFSKTQSKSDILYAMGETDLISSCILNDRLFPNHDKVHPTETLEKPTKIKKRSKKPAFLHENNNIKTRWPMSIRIGVVENPRQPAADLVNINLAEGSKNRNLTVGELLEGIAEAVAATGSRKSLDAISFEFEMWQWLPQHYFGTIRRTDDPLINHPLLQLMRPMMQPGWKGKRARIAFKLRCAARKFRKLGFGGEP